MRRETPPPGWALPEGCTPADPPYQTVPPAAALVTQIWYDTGGRLRQAARGDYLLADGTPVDVRGLARRPELPELLSVTEIEGTAGDS